MLRGTIVLELKCSFNPLNFGLLETGADRLLTFAVVDALAEAMGKPKKAFRTAALNALTLILPTLHGNFYRQVSPPMLHALETSSKAKQTVWTLNKDTNSMLVAESSHDPSSQPLEGQGFEKGKAISQVLC